MATHICMAKDTVSGHNRDPPRDLGEQGDRAFFQENNGKNLKKKGGVEDNIGE